jgi:DNA-binding response OmpR family regulator
VLVLIVEDDVRARDGLSALLEMDGCRVAVSSSLSEARRLLAEHVFDAVLVDLKLPDGNGGELIDEIRAASPGTRILLATGSTTVQHTATGLAFEDLDALAAELGAHGCVSKPIDYGKLLALLGL